MKWTFSSSHTSDQYWQGRWDEIHPQTEDPRDKNQYSVTVAKRLSSFVLCRSSNFITSLKYSTYNNDLWVYQRWLDIVLCLWLFYVMMAIWNENLYPKLYKIFVLQLRLCMSTGNWFHIKRRKYIGIWNCWRFTKILNLKIHKAHQCWPKQKMGKYIC